jgi:hypothetical protein
MDGVIVHGRSIPDPSMQVRNGNEASDQIKDRLALVQLLQSVQVSRHS